MAVCYQLHAAHWGMCNGGRSADGTGEAAFGFRQRQISGLKLKAVEGK